MNALSQFTQSINWTDLGDMVLRVVAILLCLIIHEVSHGLAAYHLGDPTAKMNNRLSLNPLRHLDLFGTLMMVVVGFGWARPVPVNPRNYRNYRRDDLKVSVAGVTMNLMLFALGLVLMLLFLAVSIRKSADPETPRIMGLLLERYDYYNVAIYQAEQSFGDIAGYLFQMLYYFTVTNLVLCVFNLLPVPPLDGYHVLNDLVLRRRQLFANPQTARIASGVLFALMLTGLLGRALGWIDSQVLDGAARLSVAALRGMGLVI